jgi:GT2 family glycosyltransferase
MLAAASHPIVASFDDDSYPTDADYFSRVLALFQLFPRASVISGQVVHRGEKIAPRTNAANWVADFVGCGCAYRRDDFLQIGGYVPIAIAYGMEEVDLALRLHAAGKGVLHSSWLRVFHDTNLEHHADATITAASIANLALLAYLRYPAGAWAVGVGQCFNRIRWLVANRRYAGIVRGVRDIPAHLRKHGRYRRTLPSSAVRSYLTLRRSPQPASASGSLDFEGTLAGMITSLNCQTQMRRCVVVGD